MNPRNEQDGPSSGSKGAADAIGRPALKLHQTEKLHALTSLRFFAALFVVLYHTFATFLPFLSSDGLLIRIASLGFVSVSFFFMLSGYILGVVYLKSSRRVRARAFYKARFARVYPLFFLTLVLDTPNLFYARLARYGFKAALLKTAGTFAANCAMLQAWIVQFRGIDNPNWSLSVETLFYLTFPLLGVALWRLSGKYIWLASIAIYLAGQLLAAEVFRRVQSDDVDFFPLLHLSTFALGILLARWQVHRQGQLTQSVQRRSGNKNLLSILMVVGLAAVVYFKPRLPSFALYDGLLAPIFALSIYLFSDSTWPPAKLLNARWLIVLGEASFGLYLFHMPIFHVFEHLGWTSQPAIFPLYLLASVSISVLSFFYFEGPARRWILRNKPVRENLEMASDAQ